MTDARKASPSIWIGRVLSTLVVIAMAADAAALLFWPETLRDVMEATGFSTKFALPLGAIVLVCAVFYAIPQTAVLGAILITGFFGGAICTHFRVGEFGSPPQLIALLLAAMAWGGLYLRDTRIRALLPIVK